MSAIDVFIVGSKGIPANYGGFETFVEKLTEGKMNTEIKYHVSCMNNDEKHFEHNGADCFNVKVPLRGAPGRILHVSRVLREVEKWKRINQNSKTIIYILGCRIGPLLVPHYKKLHKMGVMVCVNPDGLEWKRDKWNALEKKFLKLCEKCLVLNSDLAICDSKNIERYILDTYPEKNNKTTYIAYGAEVTLSECQNEEFGKWLDKFSVSKKDYYLIVGRFVPENNYETMINEFIKSDTKKDLLIVTNIEKNAFYNSLREKTGFENDSRIKFVGTVYDSNLIKKIREEAFAYIHGHEVGGTNPSLLEALASTDLNLLLDVGFNREVGEDAALYWNKTKGSLTNLIHRVENLEDSEIVRMSKMGKQRIENAFSWQSICLSYENIWMELE